MQDKERTPCVLGSMQTSHIKALTNMVMEKATDKPEPKSEFMQV